MEQQIQQMVMGMQRCDRFSVRRRIHFPFKLPEIKELPKLAKRLPLKQIPMQFDEQSVTGAPADFAPIGRGGFIGDQAAILQKGTARLKFVR